MRIIHVYLTCYFMLVAGALIILWREGVLARIPLAWTVYAAAATAVFGILLGALSRR